jgi:predicted GH43/DUF377 family glycosyl hydrolase
MENKFSFIRIKSVWAFCLTLTLLAFVLSHCSPPDHRNEFEQDSTWALLPFKKINEANPILQASDGMFICPVLKQEVKWEEKDVFNPTAVVRNGAIYLFYRAEDTIGKYNGTSRIGLAIGSDGIHFTRMKEPILYPAEDFMKVYEWEGGMEDPRIIESESGIYIMTYTAYDGKVARLCLASSFDLLNWVKQGPVFKGKYLDQWSKSGAIVGKQKGNQVIAEKINGKYWMYFGDTDLFMATSDDLIQWEPVEEDGKLKSVLKPRKGFFDSRLVESGPYALATEKGILLLYNGMNSDTEGDPELPKGAYCSGQALFSSTDPTLLIDRLDHYFLKPDQPYETEGQVNQVCFIEGLVPLNGKWFLYYGTADSKIGVAVME